MKFFATLILTLWSITLNQWQLKNAAGGDMPVLQEVSVPATVLGAYVNAGIYPDPRTALNFYDIPDVSDEGSPWKDPYLYSTTFRLDDNLRRCTHIRLRLNGINYRADVSVNGVKIADRDTVVGMFRRFDFDISDVIHRRGENSVAITVYQVDHPGKCFPGTQSIVFGPKRGSARDIWKDETLKISGGWDCAPVVPDRNMGITLPVEIIGSGDLSFGDPGVQCSVADDFSYAHVRVRAGVRQHGAVSGKVQARLKLFFPEGSSRKAVELRKDFKAGEDISEIEFPQLDIANPDLWWPNGYGAQPIHGFEISLYVDGKLSDVKTFRTGLRELKSEVIFNHGEPARVFYVNGRRIFCRGGWLQPDILLQDTRESMEHQMQLLASAGVNIAGSEDMPAPPDFFYELLDSYGILYWHVFHQCWRMYPGTASAHNPDDHSLAAAHVRDQILRYRTHCCIAAWVGVNEVMVDEDLYLATKEAARELDPLRPFIPTTSVDWDVDRLTPFLKADLPLGTTDAGAPDYGWEESEYYFRMVDKVKGQTFRNELGMPAMPVWSSLRRFIPNLDRPFDAADPIFPLDIYWAEHGAWDSNNFCYRSYDNALRTLYPDPRSARSYVRHAQLASYDGYRAMWEACASRMWDVTTGVMLWKLNSCWPDVCWQIYDWYGTPSAAYYATKNSLEPVHIQMNAHDNRLLLVNTTDKAVSAKAMVDVYKVDMTLLSSAEYEILAAADTATVFGAVQEPDIEGNWFVRLRLVEDGLQKSSNLYWRYAGHRSFYQLVNLPAVNLDKTVEMRRENGLWIMEITLANNTDRLSFFNHLELEGSEGVIPGVQWSDNFVSVFPGESVRVTASCRLSSSVSAPELKIESYE